MATAVQTPEESKGIKGRGSSVLLTTALIFPVLILYYLAVSVRTISLLHFPSLKNILLLLFLLVALPLLA